MSTIPDTADTSRKLHKLSLSTSRKVYPTDNGTVIKIPKRPGFKDVNRTEVRVWEEFGDEKIMAPIVDYADDYEWIEMVACRQLEVGKDRPLVATFEQKMDKYDVTIEDIHTENLGILPSNKEIVCLDYACIRQWD